MYEPKTACFKAATDRPYSKAAGYELTTGDHTMLALRKGGKRPLTLRERDAPRTFRTCR